MSEPALQDEQTREDREHHRLITRITAPGRWTEKFLGQIYSQLVNQDEELAQNAHVYANKGGPLGRAVVIEDLFFGVPARQRQGHVNMLYP